ncbi:cellulase family glycosylhydrolase [Lapillicoccus jejuensis]|uniref:mannan endo-1,4-beta-mannosidase n=1 Tax=Lapillicoccus jejuensis TaxID=402171 RepID=A0A542E004_9MICO|nr:cellulase family glycosylhydrolase [Lapillicoccus jejuensis]TQJ08691.1 cellulase (glycosyl hydrolase family 5) [Lapillicoccus jejuensis]
MGDRARRRPALLAALVLAGLVAGLLGACGGGGADDFVRRSGAQLTVGGEPYRFVGFNLYDAAASDVYSCAPQYRLDDESLATTLRDAKEKAGATVVRFWAYQTYTDGGRDFSGVDRFIAAAKAAGLRVLPVLEDGPGDCSTRSTRVALSQVDEGHWYSSGYRSPLGSARLSYRDYARVMAQHYKDEPAILGWMLVNEAETTERDAQGRSSLVSFAGDMAQVVHEADPNHLVTLGSQSNGAPGASGSDFYDVYRQGGLDFTEVHDWNAYGSDTEAMPGAVDGLLPDPTTGTCARTDAPVACSFAISRMLGKPIVVGESGIAATDEAGRARRARLLGAKLDAAFRDGASGYLIWQLQDSDDPLAVKVSGSDPLLPILKAAGAESLAAGPPVEQPEEVDRS